MILRRAVKYDKTVLEHISVALSGDPHIFQTHDEGLLWIALLESSS